MWTIAKLAYQELLYKRIFLIALIMSAAFIIFYGVATYFAVNETVEQIGEMGKSHSDLVLEYLFLGTQLLGVGLFLASFITILLSILGSVGSISSEIESHHIDTLLARPIPRSHVVLGKFIGLAGILIVYSLLLFTGIIAVNQLLGGEYLRVPLTTAQLLSAGALFVMTPVVVVALSMMFSSKMATMSSGIIMIIMYGISFVGGFVEQFGVLFKNQALVSIGIITSLLFPSDSLFRKMTICLFDSADDPISFASQGMFASASTPSDAMIWYAIGYGVVALLLAMRTFARRDL